MMAHTSLPTVLRLLSVMTAVTVFGCGRREGITQYTVNKVAAPESETEPEPITETPAGRAWFFKVTGPDEAVASHVDEFTDLVTTLRMENGRPLWTLPDGWREQPGEGMRFATLLFGDDDAPLEVSVIALPVVSPSHDQYVRDNVDRWRGQLGLARYADDEWQNALQQSDSPGGAGEIQQVEGDAGQITLVNLQGSTDEIPDARMLAAIVIPGTPERTPSTGGLTYDVPAGWSPGQTTALSKAAFRVTGGGQQVEITVSTAGGDLLSNVNRWRRQVLLSPITQEQLDEAARELTVDGRSAGYFELVGEEQTILGVVLNRGSQQWFFKLRGDSDLARQEKEHFEEFVQSVSFE